VWEFAFCTWLSRGNAKMLYLVWQEEAWEFRTIIQRLTPLINNNGPLITPQYFAWQLNGLRKKATCAIHGQSVKRTGK